MKLEPGQIFEVDIKYTQDQVNAFMDVTGDRNPIHFDQDYAARTVFRQPIIHGFLSASVFSRIFGTMFPGEGTIYMSQNLQFLRPMYVEENYKAIVEIAEVFPEKHRARFATRVVNGPGELCIDGEALLYNKLVIRT